MLAKPLQGWLERASDNRIGLERERSKTRGGRDRLLADDGEEVFPALEEVGVYCVEVPLDRKPAKFVGQRGPVDATFTHVSNLRLQQIAGV